MLSCHNGSLLFVFHCFDIASYECYCIRCNPALFNFLFQFRHSFDNVGGGYIVFCNVGPLPKGEGKEPTRDLQVCWGMDVIIHSFILILIKED